MKKVSLIGILLAVLMVAMVAMPVFAADGWDISSVTSSEDWLSSQTGVTNTTVTVTVTNTTPSGGEPRYGQANAQSLGTTNSFTVSGDTPSGNVNINRGASSTFTWDVSMNASTVDGLVDITPNINVREKPTGGSWSSSELLSELFPTVFGVDSTSPTATIGLTQNGAMATLNNSFNDNLSGVSSYTILVDGQPYTGSVSGIGTHKVDYTVTDNAGNQSSGTVYVQVGGWFAGNPNGTPHYCSHCGAVLQCAWLSSQFKQAGFYGWDLSVPGGKMWGICKCGNGK